MSVTVYRIMDGGDGSRHVVKVTGRKVPPPNDDICAEARKDSSRHRWKVLHVIGKGGGMEPVAMVCKWCIEFRFMKTDPKEILRHLRAKGG